MILLEILKIIEDINKGQNHLSSLFKLYKESHPDKKIPQFLYSSIVDVFQTLILNNIPYFFSQQELDSIFLLGYIVSNKCGPHLDLTINYQDDDDAEYHNLIKICGAKYAVSLGQGKGPREGLFGPFPFGKNNLSALVFSRKFNSWQDEPFDEIYGNHYLFCIIFQNDLSQIFYNISVFENLCYSLTDSIDSVDQIDEDFLSDFLSKFKYNILNTLESP
jgi:hypothetical protein